MAYHARRDILENGCMFHATWQCHNKSYFLRGEAEKKLYYDLLLKYVKRYGVEIYAYCIMSNHVHLVGSCEEIERLSGCMGVVNSTFARKINKKFNKTGQVIMDRFKSPMIEDNVHLFKASSYVELNAFKAKMVSHPKYYKWCSYNHYAYGKEDELITTSPVYKEFSLLLDERKKIYIEMMEEKIASLGGSSVEDDYEGGYYIGDSEWVKDKYEKLKIVQRQKKLKKSKIKLSRKDVLVT